MLIQTLLLADYYCTILAMMTFKGGGGGEGGAELACFRGCVSQINKDTHTHKDTHTQRLTRPLVVCVFLACMCMCVSEYLHVQKRIAA